MPGRRRHVRATLSPRIQPRSDVMSTRVHAYRHTRARMTDWEPMRAPTPPATGGPSTLPRPPGQGKAAASRPARAGTAPPPGRAGPAAARILRRGQRTRRLIHVARIPASPGRCLPWPDWVPAQVSDAFMRSRGRPALGSSGGHGRARPPGPERDHLDAIRVGEVPGVPAARAHRGAGRAHRSLPGPDPGARRRPAARGAGARPGGRPCGGGGRGHAGGRPGMGARVRDLPDHHPGHAAPHAAAPARQVERVLQPARLRDRR